MVQPVRILARGAVLEAIPTARQHSKKTPTMPLHSTLDPTSPEFTRNAEVMRGLVAELREKLKVVAGGGGQVSRARHTSRGNRLARQPAEPPPGPRPPS